MLAVESEETFDVMNEQTINLAAFHLIGRTAESGLDDICGLEFQPALYAGFRDLSTLRYDFPVVLGNYNDAGDFVHSLSDIINDVLAKNSAPGAEGEFMRCQILNLEQEIRMIATDGTGTSLTKAWGTAIRRLRARAGNGSLEALDKCLEQIQDAFWFDDQVIDCNAETPMALIRQAWAIDQRAKAHVSRKRVDELILRLENILGAEIKKSEAALLPENLKGSVGCQFRERVRFRRHVSHPDSGQSARPVARRSTTTYSFGSSCPEVTKILQDGEVERQERSQNFPVFVSLSQWHLGIAGAAVAVAVGKQRRSEGRGGRGRASVGVRVSSGSSSVGRREQEGASGGRWPRGRRKHSRRRHRGCGSGGGGGADDGGRGGDAGLLRRGRGRGSGDEVRGGAADGLLAVFSSFRHEDDDGLRRPRVVSHRLVAFFLARG